MRCLVRIPFAADESADVRRARLDQLVELVRRVPGIDGVLPVPVPVGEVQGLDALQFFAACRMACPASHLLVDLELYGHKLGQLCLAFGADEILGAITAQRALRLGEHASSNALTRDEAVLLLRASGFTPCERQPEGKVQVL
jgi:2-iminoacetate synthase ThiH